MFCQNTSKYVRDHDIVEFVNVRTKITIKGKATKITRNYYTNEL